MLAACLSGDSATCAWLCSEAGQGSDTAGAAAAAAASGTPGCQLSGARLDQRMRACVQPSLSRSPQMLHLHMDHAQQ